MNQDTINKLSEEEKKTLNKLGIRHTHKLLNRMIKVYNTLCPKCRDLAIKNTRRPLSDYCPNCQDTMRKEIQPLL